MSKYDSPQQTLNFKKIEKSLAKLNKSLIQECFHISQMICTKKIWQKKKIKISQFRAITFSCVKLLYVKFKPTNK